MTSGWIIPGKHTTQKLTRNTDTSLNSWKYCQVLSKKLKYWKIIGRQLLLKHKETLQTVLFDLRITGSSSHNYGDVRQIKS